MRRWTNNWTHAGQLICMSGRPVAVAGLLAIALCSTLVQAQSYTRWDVVCTNTYGFQCAEDRIDAFNWRTIRSPVGALGSDGHDEWLNSRLRTYDQWQVESSFGQIEFSTETGVARSGDEPVGGASAADNIQARFVDRILIGGSLPTFTLTEVRFTMVLSTTLVAEDVPGSGDYARTYADAVLKPQFAGGDVWLRTCTSAWVAVSAGCSNVQFGASQTSVSGVADLRVGDSMSFEMIAGGTSEAGISRLIGLSRASANVTARLFIEPLDSRVVITSTSGFNYAPIPEPGSWTLLGAGLGVVLLRLGRGLRRSHVQTLA